MFEFERFMKNMDYYFDFSGRIELKKNRKCGYFLIKDY